MLNFPLCNIETFRLLPDDGKVTEVDDFTIFEGDVVDSGGGIDVMRRLDIGLDYGV